MTSHGFLSLYGTFTPNLHLNLASALRRFVRPAFFNLSCRSLLDIIFLRINSNENFISHPPFSQRQCYLVSREIIADSIELMGRAYFFYSMIALVGCDKT